MRNDRLKNERINEKRELNGVVYFCFSNHSCSNTKYVLNPCFLVFPIKSTITNNSKHEFIDFFLYQVNLILFFQCCVGLHVIAVKKRLPDNRSL